MFVNDCLMLLCEWLRKKKGRKEMFYLMMHAAHFICSFMASEIWQKATKIAREETKCLTKWTTLFLLYIYMYHPTDRIVHTTALVTKGTRCSSVVRAFAHGATICLMPYNRR